MALIIPDEQLLPDKSDVIYGVWLAGTGFLNHEGKIFGTLNPDMAKQQARWFGGSVLIIDETAKDFEQQMLAAERARAQRKNTHGLFGRHQ